MTKGERQMLDCLKTGDCLFRSEIDTLRKRLADLELERARLLVEVERLKQLKGAV